MLKQATVAAAALALAAPATAHAGFKEPVHVIWQHTGAANGYFGWAASPLVDGNHDGPADAVGALAPRGAGTPAGAAPAMAGEPAPAQGTTWVLSGRTGAVFRRFDG